MRLASLQAFRSSAVRRSSVLLDSRRYRAIINHMSQGLEDGIYWVPQIVGGSGFIISGTLYMLETQKNWYTPAFGVLGWHIAFWNWIGGIGFTLCGALGPAFGNHGAQYQASCATFLGQLRLLDWESVTIV